MPESSSGRGDPDPLLPHLPGIKAAGFDHYFFFTLTDYPPEIEPRRPATGQQVRLFRQCAETTGGRVFWRYDPIVVSRATSPQDHERRFTGLAAQLAGYTTRCYISFTVWYRKTKTNLLSLDTGGAFQFVDPEMGQRRDLACRLRDIAARHGIQVHSCSDDALAAGGIAQAHCTEAALFPKAAGVKAAPLRPGCGCWYSRDIGAYDTCLFGCRYCYATSSSRAAAARRALYDPQDTMLCRPRHLRRDP